MTQAQYVIDNDLGGIMFWSIDNDDFRGQCTGRQYPLIEAAKAALFGTTLPPLNQISAQDRKLSTDTSTANTKSVNIRFRSITNYNYSNIDFSVLWSGRHWDGRLPTTTITIWGPGRQQQLQQQQFGPRPALENLIRSPHPSRQLLRIPLSVREEQIRTQQTKKIEAVNN